MNGTLACALLIPGIAFLKEWAPAIAQSVLAPIGTIYIQDPFTQWITSLIHSFKPPNQKVLVMDGWKLSDGIETRDSERPVSYADKWKFGLVLVSFHAKRKVVEQGLEYLSEDGVLVIYKDERVMMVLRQEKKQEPPQTVGAKA